MRIPEILRLQTDRAPGSLASALAVVADAHLSVEGLRAVARNHLHTIWELTLEPDESFDLEPLLDRLDALPAVRVLGRSDRVFARHEHGKIRTVASRPIDSDETLRDLYTPGVARVCRALADDPSLARHYTAKHRTVAVVTNGSAVLGLGDIGPVASLPVMEGKAALLAQLASLNAVPILLDARDAPSMIAAVRAIAPSFGAILLEDIKAPECFDVEDALIDALTIPVLHDDQHGTAVVVLASLLSASRRLGLDLTTAVIGQIGLGAAGLGVCKLLLAFGCAVLGADPREEAQQRLRQLGGEPCALETLMRSCDVVIATTGVKDLITPSMIQPGQAVFALSNPEPEIDPMTALAAGAGFAVDGKAVNNVLGFPGLFKGALDAGASRFTHAMRIAAAEALADMASDDSLIPDPLDQRVHERVAAAVARASAADASAADAPRRSAA